MTTPRRSSSPPLRSSDEQHRGDPKNLITAATDERVRLLLPTSQRAVPPTTARRQRRAITAYGVLWAVGALPGLLGLGSEWTAAGLGLALPGGGLAYGGHPVLAVTAALAVVLSVFIWWATGPTVLPPLVWLGTAVLGGVLTDRGAGTTTPQLVVLAVGPVLILAPVVVHRFRHASQVRAGARLNERLANVEFVITGPPGLDVRAPVVEHSEDDLAHLRYALDLALQPVDSFEGFTKIDQFREAATRYQLNALGYGLSMSQFTRTPAFTGYLAEAQRNAIEKMLDRRVWGYWALRERVGQPRSGPRPDRQQREHHADRLPRRHGRDVRVAQRRPLLASGRSDLPLERRRRLPARLRRRWRRRSTAA